MDDIFDTEAMAAELIGLIGNDGGFSKVDDEFYDPGLIFGMEEYEMERYAEGGCDADGVALYSRKVNPARELKARAKWLIGAFGLTSLRQEV